jgi:6-phosphogluconolactonase/glucosamine-6-phosphate isomerase/deaminase
VTFKVEVLADEEWAKTTAKRFSDLDPKRVCLATGNTMTPFLHHIAGLDLSRTTVFMLDEYGDLPVGDQGRCQSMIERDLLERADRPPTVHIPRLDPPEPQRYREMMNRGGLDLAIVGLGANGHIGMNEPGSRSDSTTRVVQLARSTGERAADYGATTTPTWGITVGMGPLLGAQELWLMVTGPGKRDILRRTLTEPIGPDLPATFLREHARCIAFVDVSAASYTAPAGTGAVLPAQ